MRTQSIEVKLRDGVMGAYLAIPDRTPAGAVIAIMEIWGVNDTMRRHAHEFAEAGFVCLVPDLFWRQEPGVELSDHNPEHVTKAFDLYYDFEPNPLVAIHKYPGADHAFARHGGKTYCKPEADRALALTVDFFRKHLGAGAAYAKAP